MKEEAIKEYLSKINFKSDNWSRRQLEEDMRKFLGEIPGIEIQYKKDVFLNEVSGESREISKVDRISIIYTDTNEKMKKFEILI